MSEMTIPLAAALKLVSVLAEIRNGSAPEGRYLDGAGTECDAGNHGATWHPYEPEEQRAWLESVASMSRDALNEFKRQGETLGIAIEIPDEPQVEAPAEASGPGMSR